VSRSGEEIDSILFQSNKKIKRFFYSLFFLQRDHFAEGLRLKKLNRLEEALASFDKAIKHNPTNSNAYNNRGICLYDLNRLHEGSSKLPHITWL
jgi:tetratricopeptide (TPR) repeat protein